MANSPGSSPSSDRGRSKSPSSSRGTSPRIRSAEERKKEHGVIQDVIRLCKERHFTTGKQVPPFLEPLACFQMRAAMLQFPERFKPGITGKDYADMLDLCVHHIAQNNCPAQETIRLQVTAQAAAFLELKNLAEEAVCQAQLLQEILKDISQIEVQDMRDTFKTVEALHARLLDYMLESGRQMDENMNLTDEMQAEICTGFESIFPQASCLFWMDLPSAEKERQVVEMAFVIKGIRIYNKYLGKGGGAFQLPFDMYKLEHKSLSERVMHLLQVLNEKAQVCAHAITLHIRSLGVQHVLIERLRDELTYHLQAFAILEDFQCFLNERFAAVTDLMDQSSEHLKTICETIGSRPCIANELVFPKFEAVGRLHKAILEELQLLRAHERSSVPFLTLAAQPLFLCTPTGIANLCSRTGYARSYYSDWKSSPIGLAKLNVLIMYTTFLPKELYTVDWEENTRMYVSALRFFLSLQAGSPDKRQGIVLKGAKVDEALEEGKELQLAGYCAVTMALYRGLLLHGDPDIGLVDVDGKLYAFSSDDDLKKFSKAPAAYLKAVENVVRKMPQLVHTLRLQNQPPFSSLSISEFIDLLNEPFACEFSTQTSTHIIPPYRWTEETFYKRALRLTNKETESTQTDCCYFRRSSTTQVWPPKEKWTQTRFNKGTKMTRHVRHMHGLRGPPTVQFKMLQTKYDV